MHTQSNLNPNFTPSERPEHRVIKFLYKDIVHLEELLMNAYKMTVDDLMRWNHKLVIELLDMTPLIQMIDQGEDVDVGMMDFDQELIPDFPNHVLVVVVLSQRDVELQSNQISQICRKIYEKSSMIPIRVLPNDCFRNGKLSYGRTKTNTFKAMFNFSGQYSTVMPRMNVPNYFYTDLMTNVPAVDYISPITQFLNFHIDGDTMITSGLDQVLRFIDWRTGRIIDAIDLNHNATSRSTLYTYPIFDIDNQNAKLYFCTFSSPYYLYVIDLITRKVENRFILNYQYYRIAVVEDDILLSTTQDTLNFNEVNQTLACHGNLSSIHCYNKETGVSRVFFQTNIASYGLWNKDGTLIKPIPEAASASQYGEGMLLFMSNTNKMTAYDIENDRSLVVYGNYSYNYGIGRKFAALKHNSKPLIIIYDFDTDKKFNLKYDNRYPTYVKIQDNYLYILCNTDITVWNLRIKKEILRVNDIAASLSEMKCNIQ